MGYHQDPILLAQGGQGSSPYSNNEASGGSSWVSPYPPVRYQGAGQDLQVGGAQSRQQFQSAPQMNPAQMQLGWANVSTDEASFTCWGCRVKGHSLYTCRFIHAMNRLLFAYRNWIFSHPTANATYAQAQVEQSRRKFPGADFRAPPEAAIVPQAVPEPPLLDCHGPSTTGAYRQAPASTPSRYEPDRHPRREGRSDLSGGILST